jgi:hypothetical protein
MRLRYKPLFMAMCTAAAVMAGAVTLVVNPKFKPRKTAELAVAMQNGLARILRGTPLVKISPFRSS